MVPEPARDVERLRHLAPSLREAGDEVIFARDSAHSRYRLIRLKGLSHRKAHVPEREPRSRTAGVDADGRKRTKGCNAASEVSYLWK